MFTFQHENPSTRGDLLVHAKQRQKQTQLHVEKNNGMIVILLLHVGMSTPLKICLYNLI